MDSHTEHTMVMADSSAIEYMKLAGVLVIITAFSYLLYSSYGSGGVVEYLRWFMGVFFVVFAAFKFVGYTMFAQMYAGYDIVAKRFKAYGYAYPFIELILGLLYLTNVGGVIRDVITVIIMAVGSIGVYHEIKRRSGIHCACLGNIIKLPLGTVSLVEDVGMGLMAVVMILF